MRLTTNVKQAKRLIAKPNFKSFKIINEDLTLVTLSKTEVVMNKPIAVGTAILDIAKQIVYDFHYNFVQKRFVCHLSCQGHLMTKPEVKILLDRTRN